MAKGEMDELFTPYKQQAALAAPRPARVIRVRPHHRGSEVIWYMDGWPWPVPAWARRLDGRTIGQVAAAFALALLAVGGAAWALWRLLGGAR